MPLTDGTKYLPKYNWGMGMNDEVARDDQVTYATSTEMLTEGVAADWGDFGGLEVGNAYDMDVMGEDRSKMTFPAENAKGMIGMLATSGAGRQPTDTSVGGKRVDLSAPQTYSKAIRNPGKND